ncbi:MAG: tetratricopeptide repeat protein [Nitrospirae bacterium]|nr:tetratricopeptide repeat protein [Nitrospirota bacterium]
MEATRSRKETVVILFFWLIFGGMVIMSMVNLALKSGESGQESAGPQQAMPLEERIREVKAFLEDNPDNPEALVALGDLYFESNQVYEGIEVFKRAEKLEPESVHIQNDLGILYQKTGKYELAIEKFRNALRLDPTHLNSLFHIGLIYRYNMGDNEKALEAFEELLAKNPEPRVAKMAAEEVERIKAEGGS